MSRTASLGPQFVLTLTGSRLAGHLAIWPPSSSLSLVHCLRRAALPLCVCPSRVATALAMGYGHQPSAHQQNDDGHEYPAASTAVFASQTDANPTTIAVLLVMLLLAPWLVRMVPVCGSRSRKRWATTTGSCTWLRWSRESTNTLFFSLRPTRQAGAHRRRPPWRWLVSSVAPRSHCPVRTATFSRCCCECGNGDGIDEPTCVAAVPAACQTVKR